MEENKSEQLIELKDILKKVNDHLKMEEYNEGLSILETLPQFPETDDLKNKFQTQKYSKIQKVLENAKESMANKHWKDAENLINQAKALDEDDKEVKAIASKYSHEYQDYLKSEGLRKDLQTARDILNREMAGLKDAENAIGLLESADAKKPGDPEIQDMLVKAKKWRKEFLRKRGLVATLEQLGKYDEALKEIDNLIERGETVYKDNFGERDIEEYRADLEIKVRDFSDEKANKRLQSASKAIANDPKLALKHINEGLNLPFVPNERKEDMEDLKLEVERSIEELEKTEAEINEGLTAMNEKNEYQKAIGIFKKIAAKYPQLHYVQEHLKDAKKSWRNQSVQRIKRNLAQASSLVNLKNLEESKNLLQENNTLLELLDQEPEITPYQDQCHELMAAISAQEGIENQVKEIVPRLEDALKSDNLIEAELLLASLDKEARDHLAIRTFQVRLTSKQGLHTALDQVRLTFEEERLDSAREQIKELKSRYGKNEEVLELSLKIDTNNYYKTGKEAYEEGDLKAARNAFEKLVELNSLYKENAQQYLKEIELSSKSEAIASEVYENAQRQQNKGDLEGAYKTLREMPDEPSSLKKDMLDLKVEVRDKWQRMLREQIQEYLEAKLYSEAHALATKLEKVQDAGDRKIIYEVKKTYTINQAQLAEEQNKWDEALKHWQDAQQYDNSDTVRQGMQNAQKRKAIKESDAAAKTSEKISILEEVYNIQEPDYEIEERLIRACLSEGKYNRAMNIAMARVNEKTSFAKTAETVKDLCQKLTEADEKYDKGAYVNSFDILNECMSGYPQFRDYVVTVYRTRQSKVTEKLFKEARDLEIRNESVVKILPLYQEILHIEPENRKAMERHKRLTEDFRHFVDDRIHKCIKLEKEDNNSLHDVEEIIREIELARTVASEEQSVRLEPHLKRLLIERSSLKSFDDKIKKIDPVLREAKETGDFDPVDQILSEASKFVSLRNYKFAAKKKEVHDVKKKYSDIHQLAEQISNAFRAEDYNSLEHLTAELKKLDADDEYEVQKKRLVFKDPGTGDEIPFKELESFARERHQNLDTIQKWFNGHYMGSNDYQSEADKLRSQANKDFDNLALARGLLNQSKQIDHKLRGLPDPPEKPLTRNATDLVYQANIIKENLQRAVKQLEDEANSMLSDMDIIKELENKAGDLIEDGKFKEAMEVVEQGLKMDPFHEVLKYFQQRIQNEF
ncbi:MAG: hypothetical protein GY795_18620 [Desulfobacterales bacterium]|nr:hypothetical protein [Desulfobacterales bacterium]